MHRLEGSCAVKERGELHFSCYSKHVLPVTALCMCGCIYHLSHTQHCLTFQISPWRKRALGIIAVVLKQKCSFSAIIPHLCCFIPSLLKCPSLGWLPIRTCTYFRGAVLQLLYSPGSSSPLYTTPQRWHSNIAFIISPHISPSPPPHCLQ